ncbi:hypothetical protein ACFL59_00630 [Planctomycetota bacterium]
MARVFPLLGSAATVILGAMLLAPAPARADVHDTPNGNGALAGKTVVISGGHGKTPKSGGWYYQRPTTPTSYQDRSRVQEDIHNNEIVIEYLQRYLSNAGAVVFTCRERSFQRNEVLIDNRDAGYGESGTWEPQGGESQSHSDYFGSGYRYHRVSTVETASARFSFTVPTSGRYPVYVWYTPSSNRSTDALYRIHHLGGVTEVRVDQQRYRAFWFYLGAFAFASAQPGAVTLSNQGSDTSKFVVADGVRIGGGIGPSGEPRWKEAAKIFLPYAGFPYTGNNDVTVRPLFANWIAGNPEASAHWRHDFRFVSLHTNAGSGSNRGTMTISYTNGRTPSWSGYGTGAAHYPCKPDPLQDASDGFRDVFQAELLRDLRHAYGSWRGAGPSGGLILLNLGELRMALGMPSCLTELAFHDSPADVDYLRDARFRELCGRAMYKAVARSFDPGAIISPLRPGSVVVENIGGGRVRASWESALDPLEPTAVPVAFRIYQSRDGLGFDDGLQVSGTSVELGPFSPGETIYVRIAAVNAGGESLSTRVLGARVAASGAAEVLIVDGFERPFQHNYKNMEARYPTDLVRSHGTAFAAATGLAFDSADAAAVAAGRVALGTYAMLDWFTGQESTEHETLSDDEQLLLSSYLQGGGALLLSGSEIGWDLHHKGSATDKDFYGDWLRAAYLHDDAGTFAVEPESSGCLASVAPLTLDDGTHGGYEVRFPDVLAPGAGAGAALAYGNGAGVAALEVDDNYRLIYLGFPLEGVYDDAARGALVAAACDMLLRGLGGSGGTGGAATGASTAAPAYAPTAGGGSGCTVSASAPLTGFAPLLLVLVGLSAAVVRRRARP